MKELLVRAGVPEPLHGDAIDALAQAKISYKGLAWHKIVTKLFKANEIARKMKWHHNRLIEADEFMALEDVAPMLNITGHGDNGPWVETPEGGRPIQDYWLSQDVESDEYKAAVAACYWCPGHHPRSREARKAWYRRNGGEFLAWSRGCPVDPSVDKVERWKSDDGLVEVLRLGRAWQINAFKPWFWKLGLDIRVGYEIDNVMSGPLAPQMWYPLPGYSLNAPVVYNRLPGVRK